MVLKLHTLGPKTTDSYRAAMHILQQAPFDPKTDIVLHPSFDDIYDHLNALHGDLFLVPVAYRGQTDHDDWGNNNLKYCQILKIVRTFSLPTFPMLLVQNFALKNHRVILHPSTLEIIIALETKTKLSFQKTFVDSKPLAAAKFKANQYELAIISKNTFDTDAASQKRIIGEYCPEMVWCLYQIK